MSLSHRYRNFGSAKAPGASHSEDSTEATEDQKLEAFEAGYQAGWDDASKAQVDERQQIASSLAQNLQDMSFTYHEALSKLTVSIEPVMGQIIEKVLPEMVKSAVGLHIVEQVNELLKDQVSGTLEISVSPESVASVEQILEQGLPEPFRLVADDNLGDGQAFLRFPDAERQIDLDTVVEDVSKAMAGFFHEAEQRGENG